MPVDALFESGQVLHGDAGQPGELIAAQSGDAPPAMCREPHVLRPHARPARLEELAKKVASSHLRPMVSLPEGWLAARDRRTVEAMKTWFITGASRGFGHTWTAAALRRGDRVAATARHVETLKELSDTYGDRLLPLALDITDRARVFAAVDRAADTFGGLDVVVNNAGYGLFGMVEETTEEQARAQIDTNLFGALWVTQAALPVMRARGGGHIIQVSSIGGIAAFPTLGLYNASKWALEGMSEALAQEVGPLGIKVTIVEPGPYGTDWAGDSSVHTTPIDAYEPIREARRAGAAARAPRDPAVTARALLRLVDLPEPPLRLFLGGYPYAIAEKVYRERLDTWQQWRELAETA
jgi:NAD(P)-dependent dehydrogenase (short-subunit alcohol dehydrogenase family)